jgi:biotin carboxyl carrier protein
MEKYTNLETLIIGGTAYKTQLTEKYKNRKPWQEPNPKLILAYIPGTINKIFVKEGQKVKEGTKLLILEAMKMKNLVAAPMAGNIKSIKVAEGDMVPKNQILIELE